VHHICYEVEDIRAARLATLWVASGPPETWTYLLDLCFWTYKNPATLPAVLRDKLDRTLLPN